MNEKLDDKKKLGWVVKHGGVWQSGRKGPGETASLTEAEAHEIDPTIKDGVGFSLVRADVHEREQAGNKAKADKIAELEANDKKAKADKK